MKIKYIVYRDGDYYVSQCLNVNVSSFGETIQEAIDNIKEAVTLYFEDEHQHIETFSEINEALIGELEIYA